jgi:hypothetical protein
MTKDPEPPATMKIDLHGYHPSAIVGPPMAKIIEQAWEMGVGKICFIHGHGRARHIAGFREHQYRLFRALHQARIAEQQGPSPLDQIHHARLRRLGRDHRQAESQFQSDTNRPRPRRAAGSQLCAMTGRQAGRVRLSCGSRIKVLSTIVTYHF